MILLLYNIVIDWITLKLPLPHQHFTGGYTLFLNEYGEITGEREKGKSFEGSATNTIYIASNSSDELFLHGNPAKFLQGHNLYGIDNAYRLVELFLYYFYDNNLINFNIFDVRDGLHNAEIVRIDINYSFSLNSNDDVDLFLDALHYKAKTRHGKATRKGDTVYLGKHSKRWSLKFYNKLAELKTAKEAKKLYDNLTVEQVSLIYKEAKTLLRAELTLRGLELKKLGLEQLIKWSNETMSKTIFNDYLKKLQLKEQVLLSDDKLSQLPMSVRTTYSIWSQGLSLIPNVNIAESTFYRHRRILLNFGINISLTRDKNTKSSNVIPLIRYLEAEPTTYSKKFIELGLIAS